MPTKKAIFMETTEVPMEKTAAEISSCLVQAGATTIHTRYENGKINGLEWTMAAFGKEVQYTMPARVEPVYRILCKRRDTRYGDKYFASDLKAKLRAQAERVAWRQLLRWVQAQLAMIDIGMVKNSEVFMPYMQQADGTTFFEYFESKQLALPAPEQDASVQ